MKIFRFLILMILILPFQFVFCQKLESVNVNKSSFTLKIKFEKEKYTENITGNYLVRDYFEHTDESDANVFKLPKKQFIIAIPPNSKPTLTILNSKTKISKKTVPLRNSQSELNIYNNVEFRKTKNLNIISNEKIFWLRDFYCLAFNITNHTFDHVQNNIVEIDEIEIEVKFTKNVNILEKSPLKVKSKYDAIFNETIINSPIAEQFRSQKPTKQFNQDNWIQYSNDYLKFEIPNDGIYRITYDDLQTYGIIPGMIEINKLKMFYKGIQVPIFISDGNDSVLNEGDYIEFWGTKNYSEKSYKEINLIDEPYNEYLDRYSEASIYWLNWSGENGLRFQEKNSFNENLNDTLKYYNHTDHYERNNFLDYFENNIVGEQHPDWQSTETWFWSTQKPETKSWPFTLTKPEVNSKLSVNFKIFGFASNINDNAHAMALQLNDIPTLFDSTLFNRFEQKILNLEVDANLLNEGNNTLKSVSFETDAFPNSIVIDWYDIAYSRRISVEHDSLKIKFPKSITEKEYIVDIDIQGTDDYVIYNIGDSPTKINNQKIFQNNLYFSDLVKSKSEYIIQKVSSITKPTFLYKKTFNNLLASDEAEYLLITHPDLFNTAHNYVNFISDNYDVTSKAISVNSIYDQYNYGMLSPAAIKLFLQNAYNSWNEKKPQYVFLVGESNYDFHNNLKLENYTPNLVPSYGHPVSDNWYVIWDSLSLIPQMSIGRLTAKSIGEFEHYFVKHQKYVDDEFDEWNKSYLLLSGGLDEGSRSFSKTTNQKVLNESIKPAPVGGYYSFLYSTTTPPTNFGPFKPQYIDSVFSTGAVAISYIGHSGTKIWDNGIEEVTQLNSDNEKSTFITDFGCSTGKFAEPDIVSFSEAHTSGMEGNAIGYIGNSSLGFTSTTNKFPSIFYSELLKANMSIGDAFITSKIKFLNTFSNTPVNNIFIYTNTLFADPILNLNIPQKPNLNISHEDISFPEYLDDNLDSIYIEIKYRNLGKVDTTKFVIEINDIFKGVSQFTKKIEKSIPLNNDFLNVAIPIKSLAGKHNLQIKLDALEKLSELNESDNNLEINFDVLTSSLRTIGLSSSNNRFEGFIKLLNSVQKNNSEKFIYEISESENLSNPIIKSKRFDTISTIINYENLELNKRYYLRTKLENSEDYFETISFINSNEELSYNYFSDSTSFSSLPKEGLLIKNDSLKLEKKSIELILSSDGFNSGGLAKVQLDNVDYANNPQGCGHQIIVFDDKNFKYIESKWFNMWADLDYTNYIHFLDTLSSDKFIAISLNNFCGGAGVNQALINKLHEYGSTYIDSVTWNSSWIFLGKKGNPSGSIIEKFSNSSLVSQDTSFITENEVGWVETDYFDEGIKLQDIKFNGIFNDSTIIIKPIVLNKINSSIDTLENIYPVNGYANIGNTFQTDSLRKKLKIYFRKSKNIPKPSIDDINLRVKLPSELSINYQVVELDRDSVQQGESIELRFSIYNVGETTAEKFKVKVDLVNPNNSKENIYEVIVDSISADSTKAFKLLYNTTAFNGTRSFEISVDTENNIPELFEDNNYFSIPFVVVGDTTKPKLNLTIDGNDIFDGEYISSSPEIIINLSEPSLIPITDTSAISLFLNNSYINYSGNEDNINVNYSESNPKVTVNFTPTLEDGEYTLRVFGKDASGNIGDSSGITKSFIVQNDPKLLDVFNYPNPFKDNTYFTFKLTQIPDEIKIKVFTVAGRLIKEIELNNVELNYDLNKIYWDGKDNDGDRVGNGVYLYKVIMNSGGVKKAITQKLAIIR